MVKNTKKEIETRQRKKKKSKICILKMENFI